MLSTENPAGPSCSSKLPAVRTLVRASPDSIPSQERDPVVLQERRIPNFSVRDYVFTSRSKGIEASWPFAAQFLQPYLKHGVNDLLPPFENPDTVRTQSLCKVAQLVQPAACSKPERIAAHFDVLEPADAGPSDGALASVLQDPTINPSPEDGKSAFCRGFTVNELGHSDDGTSQTMRTPQQAKEISSRISGLPCLVSLSGSSSKAQFQPEVIDLGKTPEKLCEPLEKKNRLIPKLDTILETSKAEDLAEMHSIALNVCPVCRIFSCTLITTLNAHMDQCLSMGSNSKAATSNVPKHRVKPRKRRLMMDIYATSCHCTLEDLDKRNGTSWASELSLIAAPVNSFCAAHTKRPEVSPTDSTNNGNGAVSADPNGVKLRILSKFKGQKLSKENFKLRKHAKEPKENKDKHFASKHLENKKLKAQKQQLISLNMLQSQIQAAAQVDCETENHQKSDKSPSHVSDSGDHEKRADILQKMNKKENCSTLEDMESITSELQSINGNLTGSPGTERVNFLHNPVHSMDESKRDSPELPSSSRWPSEGANLANGIILKLSRSSGSLICSSVMKSKETDMATWEDSDSNSNSKMVLSRSCCSLLKDETNTTSKKNTVVRSRVCLQPRKLGAIEKPFISKKLQKHRTDMKKGKNSPSNSAGVCSPTVNIHLLRTRETGTMGSHQSYTPSSITMFGGEDMNDVSPSRRNDTEHLNIVEEQKSNTSNNLSSGAECSDTEIETSDSGDYATRISMIKAVPENSEKAELPFSTKSGSPSCVEHAQTTSEIEAHAEQLKQAFDEQQRFSGEGSSIDIGNQEIQAKKDCCTIQLKECQAETLSVQESSGCLTGHGDEGLEMPEKNSSIDSVRMKAIFFKNLSSEGEPSGSPVSTDSKSQVSEVEPLSIAVNTRESIHLATPSAESIEATQDRNLKNWKQENSNIRPPHQSVSVKSSLDFAVKISSPRPSHQSQIHSVSSPILRLMGKNLMVVNHEEIVQPQTTALDCTQQVNHCASSNNHLKREISPYQHNQLSSGSPAIGSGLPMGDHQMPLDLPSTSVGGFAWASLQNGCRDQQTQQRKSSTKLTSSHHTLDKVIVIDCSPKHEADLKGCLSNSTSTLPNRPLSCYPLQHHIRDYPRI
ncbi:unnamed protein product [Musa banksii]